MTGQIAKLVFDPATGLAKELLYDAVTDGGQVSVTESYGDYRDVERREAPFQTVVTVAGKRYQEIVVKTVQLNAASKFRIWGSGHEGQGILKAAMCVVAACWALSAQAQYRQSAAERGKLRIVYEALKALGGDAFA